MNKKLLYMLIPVFIVALGVLITPRVLASLTTEEALADAPEDVLEEALYEEVVTLKDDPAFRPYFIEDSMSLRETYKDTSFNREFSIPLDDSTKKSPFRLELSGAATAIRVISRYDVVFVSLEEMAGVLDYTLGLTINPDEILLKKETGEEIIMTRFKEDHRNGLVEIYHNDFFQKDVALEGKPFKTGAGEFMVPLENLITLLGYEDIILSDSYIKASMISENHIVNLSDLFIKNDKLIKENYFTALDELQTPSEVDFILLGDLSLGTNFGQRNKFDKIWQKEGGAYFLEELQPYFNESDLVITNLENVFTKRNAYQKGKIYTYKAHRIEYLDVLSQGGITHVNVVNNHMVDFLQEGFDDTLDYLKDYGISYFGANLTESENIELGSIRVDEYQVFKKDDIKIGLVGYMGFNTSFVSDEKIKEDIKTLKEEEKVDYIVAAMHWGGQGTHEVTPKQKEMGRKLVDFGVDLVYGNHPHVLQEVEIYQGKPIYYSLGNFLFTDYKSAKDPDSAMVKVTLCKDADGNLTTTFTHTPIFWSGHPYENLYKPMVTTDRDLINRTLRKLNITTKESISFNKDEDS